MRRSTRRRKVAKGRSSRPMEIPGHHMPTLKQKRLRVQ
jgi:hypothetical protein